MLIHQWWSYSIREFPKVYVVLLCLSPWEPSQSVLAHSSVTHYGWCLVVFWWFLSFRLWWRERCVCLGRVVVSQRMMAANLTTQGLNEDICQAPCNNVWSLINKFGLKRKSMGTVWLTKSPLPCHPHTWFYWILCVQISNFFSPECFKFIKISSILLIAVFPFLLIHGPILQEGTMQCHQHLLFW